MKPIVPLLAVSLVANLALGAWWLVRPAPVDDDARTHSVSATGLSPAATSSVAPRSSPSLTPSPPATDPAALRDRLRVLGFSEYQVGAAVRALIESPRLQRERALRAAAAGQPWWRTSGNTFTAEQNRELRELRATERAGIALVLGSTGDITPVDADHYAYFSADKAFRLAAIRRDFIDMRREIQAGPGTPAEIAARLKLLDAEREKDLDAALTPAERQQYDLRTTTAGLIVSSAARYFSARESDYLALYELSKKRQAEINGPQTTERGSAVAAGEKYEADLQAILGDRYAEYKRASQADSTALLELQRRFAVPATTTDAVAALVRTVGDEGMAVARDKTLTVDQQRAALLELANSARQRVVGLLGDDLGGAYNTASAPAWLDGLERGMVPFIQPNGQRAIFLVGHDYSRTRTPAPKK